MNIADKYTALMNESDVHVLTGALKLFFRELQEPAIPIDLHPQFLNSISQFFHVCSQEMMPLSRKNEAEGKTC